MHKHERGAVSLFVVIFATLLITVVTVSFLRLMVQNQQEASAQDLSQSAYDSAQAGVQDAERALLRFEACQQGNSCSSIDTTTWQTCNGIMSSQLNPSNPAGVEIPISQSGTNDGTNLNQAYTCVKVNLNTDNVVGSAAESGQRLIPLSGTDTFAAVQVDWFSQKDLSTSNTNYQVTLQNPASPLPLLQQYNAQTKQGWSPDTPSVLRVQLMQFSNGNFTLSDFDNMDGTNGSDGNTLFLYPIAGIVDPSHPQTDLSFPAGRQVPTGSPTGVVCSSSLSSGGYACSASISLPAPINGGDRTAYLRITPMYNASHFQVKLLQDDTHPVQFKNVQPSIDSTGRANNLYRRVVTRVDLLNQNLPYPTDAVDLTGSFCKEFAVTTDASQYPSINSNNSCKP